MMMIERMAKGMFDAVMERRYCDLPHNIPTWPPTREVEQEWLGLARAALTALLEPSEAMIDAVWDRTHPACGDPLPQPDEKPGEGWVPGALRAAIQAALDEKEG